ncbi:MAG TPA: hypothetical protein VJ436_11580 [Anaerolineales bacterium]|nr:hypothetical protein [Anaerolineales bacterium]
MIPDFGLNLDLFTIYGAAMYGAAMLGAVCQGRIHQDGQAILDRLDIFPDQAPDHMAEAAASPPISDVERLAAGAAGGRSF